MRFDEQTQRGDDHAYVIRCISANWGAVNLELMQIKAPFDLRVLNIKVGCAVRCDLCHRVIALSPQPEGHPKGKVEYDA